MRQHPTENTPSPADRLRAERARAGLPLKITSTSVLRRVAAVIRAPGRPCPSKSKAPADARA